MGSFNWSLLFHFIHCFFMNISCICVILCAHAVVTGTPSFLSFLACPVISISFYDNFFAYFCLTEHSIYYFILHQYNFTLFFSDSYYLLILVSKLKQENQKGQRVCIHKCSLGGFKLEDAFFLSLCLFAFVIVIRFQNK